MIKTYIYPTKLACKPNTKANIKMNDMLNQKIKDRYGNELNIGSEVLYCDYKRDSSIYEGKIENISQHNIIVW